MRFRNPSNGYVEERQYPALGALLFGGLYFLGSGLWAPALIWLIVAVGLFAALGPPAALLMLAVNVGFAVAAPSIVRSSYLRKGWTDADDGTSGAQTATERKCPFCAETIKQEAIVCRHCGRDVPKGRQLAPWGGDNGAAREDFAALAKMSERERRNGCWACHGRQPNCVFCETREEKVRSHISSVG